MALATLPMANASAIENRLLCILSTQRKRDMLSQKSVIISSAIALLILLPLAGLKLVARAAAPPPKTTTAAKGINPKAMALVKQMVNAYGTLKSYSGTEMAAGSPGLGMPYKMDVTFKRPSRYVFVIHKPSEDGAKAMDYVSTIFLNKKYYYLSSNTNPHKMELVNMPEKNYSLIDDALTIKEDIKFPLITGLLQQSTFLINSFMRPRHNEIMTLSAPSTVGGAPVDTVIIRTVDTSGSSSMAVLKIGQSDHLLRQIIFNDTSPNEPPFHTTQTFLYVAANPVLPASTFVFKAPPGAVVVDEKPAGADADPKAVALIRQMYAADAALKSYSCHIIETLHGPTYGQNGMTFQTHPLSQKFIEVRKPYAANLTYTSQWGVEHAVSDGTTLYLTASEHENSTDPHSIQALPMRYLKLPLKEDRAKIVNDISSFDRLPAIGSDGNQMFIPEDILGWVIMPADDYNWKMGAPAIVDGSPVDTVTLRENDLNDANYSIITLAISKKDHLLRQLITAYHQTGQPVQYDISAFKDIMINPAFPNSTFLFTPAPGSKPVKTWSELFTKS